MRILHKWQGSLAYNAILNMSGNESLRINYKL